MSQPEEARWDKWSHPPIGRLFRILEDSCPADHEVFFAPLDWQPDRRTSLEPDLLVVAKDRIGEKIIT